MAAYIGSHRRLRAVFRGRQHRHGRADGDEWEPDVQAAAAEMAAAKALDRFWSDGPDPDPEGDVGSNAPKIHVRHTALDDGRLILRPDDPDEGPFVLVTGSVPAFRVVGWITGGEGRAAGTTFDGNGRPPCVMVPQSSLRPIEELRAARALQVLRDAETEARREAS